MPKDVSSPLNNVKEWIDFKAHVVAMHPRFFERLLAKHPNLKPREIKICALLLMDCETLEIANHLEMTVHAVDSTRATSGRFNSGY